MNRRVHMTIMEQCYNTTLPVYIRQLIFLKYNIPTKQIKELKDKFVKAYNTENVIILMGMEKQTISITNLETNETIVI